MQVNHSTYPAQKPLAERKFDKSSVSEQEPPTEYVEEPFREQGLNGLDHEDVAVLAYELWTDRGCPQGSPDDDWFHAIQVLRGDNAA